MKLKYLSILIGLICFVGCNRVPDTLYTIERTRYSVQVFDGCQYIVSAKDSSIAHKGNCTNICHKFHN